MKSIAERLEKATSHPETSEATKGEARRLLPNIRTLVGNLERSAKAEQERAIPERLADEDQELYDPGPPYAARAGREQLQLPISSRDVEPLIQLLRGRLPYRGGEGDADLLHAIGILARLPLAPAAAELNLVLSVSYPVPPSYPGETGRRSELRSEYVDVQVTGSYAVFMAGGHEENSCGGDSFSRTVFECYADGSRTGDLQEWLDRMKGVSWGLLEVSFPTSIPA